MHIKDYNDAMTFFRNSKQLESNGKWKEFVEESKFDDMLEGTMAQEPRTMAQGGQVIGKPGGLVEPGFMYYANKVVVDGKKFKSIRDAAHHFGIVSEGVAAQRIAKGKSVKKALTTPPVIGSEVKKRSSSQTKVLDQYAQQMYGKNYKELEGYDRKVHKKDKVLNKANSQNWKFVKVTQHEKSRLPLDPKDQAKMVEAFDFKFDFKEHPKYGVPKNLPNGKTNPQYQQVVRFKDRGFKMWDVGDVLTKKEIANVMDSHELPKGVKEWNFLSEDNPKGFKWGVDSKKHQGLSNRIKSTVLGKVKNTIAADYASPKGWMIHSMHRVWKNQMKHNNKSDYKPLYNKDKSKIIGFQDNTASLRRTQ